jgi:riboflavin-specific deaminase-like protein
VIRALDLTTAVPVEEVYELVAAETRPTNGRPWLMVNMVGALDGATSVGGGASGLSDPDDQDMFRALRAVADVILVGASTVRAENYGPVTLTDHQRTRRLDAGRADRPRLAIVSASLRLDPDSRLFSDRDSRPYIFTGSGVATEHLADRAEVVTAASATTELSQVLGRLWDDGHQIVLCEGGPTLNAQLVAADLVDELDLSLAPVLVGGKSKRLLESVAPFDPPVPFTLDRVLVGKRTLFARYLRDRP